MAGNTKQRLIDTATRRFYRDGFRNVGIDQILGDVGISKTAFYKHFVCKEDLMLAALEGHDIWYRDVFRLMIQKHGGDNPIDQLHAVMEVVDEVIHSEDFHGCIFVNAAMEFPLPQEPAHAAAAKNKEAIEMIVSEIAAKAGVVEPAALARELCLIVEGAYVTYTVTCNAQAVEIAKNVAHRVIDAHLSRSRKVKTKIKTKTKTAAKKTTASKAAAKKTITQRKPRTKVARRAITRNSATARV